MPKKPMKWSEQNRVKRVADPLKINGVNVIHLVRDEVAAGSNPATPTNIFPCNFKSMTDRRVGVRTQLRQILRQKRLEAARFSWIPGTERRRYAHAASARMSIHGQCPNAH